MANARAAKTWPKHFALDHSRTKNPVIVFKTVVSADVERGMALVLSSNKVAEAASNSGSLFGIALAAGAVGDSIPVAVGCQENVFIGQVDNADISALSFPFTCDLVEVSNEHRVDVGASVEDVFNVVEPVSEDDLTDTTDGARVRFQILRSTYDNLVAAQ